MIREDLNEIRNIRDMLDGNLNRMCVTNDLKELQDMCDYAKRRVQDICDINYGRIKQKQDEQELFEAKLEFLYEPVRKEKE